jgi:tryptophan synthase alpha chain
VKQSLARIKQYLNLPIAVGFGIRDAQTARALAKIADAVVIGSRLVQLLESVVKVEELSVLADFVTKIRSALDQAVSAFR